MTPHVFLGGTVQVDVGTRWRECPGCGYPFPPHWPDLVIEIEHARATTVCCAKRFVVVCFPFPAMVEGGAPWL